VIFFDLDKVVEFTNREVYELFYKICLIRKEKWIDIVKYDDLNAMARFLTGDHFSEGLFMKDTFHLSVRIPVPTYSKLGDFSIIPPNHINS